jgi:small subunit ribosomal protein S18
MRRPKGSEGGGGPRGKAQADRKKRYKKFGEKSRCRFCRSKEEVDYKNIGVLQKLCTNQARLFSRKRSGNCANHQRRVKEAVKYARYLGLLPYVAN